MITFNIEHQPEENLFFVNIEGEQRAFLKYRRMGSRAAQSAIDIWSTFVPESHRGTGLAAQLVEHAFSWAAENRLHVEASCWYAAKKMEQRQT